MMTTPQPRNRDRPEDQHTNTREWAKLLATLDGATTPCQPGQAKQAGADWTSDNTTEQQRAARLCQPCHARPACLAYALATQQSHGVWGGMTSAQRKAEQRKRRQTNHPKAA